MATRALDRADVGKLSMADIQTAAVNPAQRNRRGTCFTIYCIVWVFLPHLALLLFAIQHIRALLGKTSGPRLQLWLCLIPHGLFAPWVLIVLVEAVRLARPQGRTRPLALYFAASMACSAGLMAIAAHDYYASAQATRTEILLTVAASAVVFAAGLLVGLQKLVLDSRRGWLHARLQPFHFRSEQEDVLEV